MSLHIGTMGWSYNHWVGNFYPSNIKAQDFLFEYSKHFNSVEINRTFYRTPSASTVKQWKRQTPSNFIFSAKLPKSITHIAMLQKCDDKLSFFLNNISILNDKLGPLLIQLPPQFKPDRFKVLRDFLAHLPTTNRFALEVRNKDLQNERLYSLLRDRNVAVTMVDRSSLRKASEATGDFIYIRWEGERSKIKGNSGEAEIDRCSDLRSWTKLIQGALDNSTDVFGYFSKFYSGYPPGDAEQLLVSLSNL